LTEWRMDQPVRRVGFTAGYFKIKTDTTKIENGNNVGLEYYKERDAADPTSPFVLSELGNGVRYFTTLFGPYPYSRISAINVSTPYTENFPTILVLPRVYDSASSVGGYLFRGREIAHQWWGNFIPWRSYRDQWLDEGLAQYSGLLYTRVRDSDSDEEYLISLMYNELLGPPGTLTGIGAGHLADVGPIIMGRRLSTRETLDAWDALVRDKGALVLRMLNFLFSDPSTGTIQLSST
jgi:aminopeptidase N